MMILGALAPLEIGFLNKWAPFHSRNGNSILKIKCGSKKQKNLTFNPLWAFELLLQHLEHEALETYESWTEKNVI